MTFSEFEERCTPAALELEDRLHRYVSAPQEYELSSETILPFVYVAFLRVGAIMKVGGKEALRRSSGVNPDAQAE